MSDTPRADAHSGWGVTYRGRTASTELYVDSTGPFVHAQFARQLERELNAANERIKRLKEALSLVRVECGNVHHGKNHRHECGQPCPVVEFIEQAKEAKP